jgi:hypothetical protein
MISFVPMSFPSLTHLTLTMNPDICIPTTMSHLLLLKSLTDFRLLLSKCQPKIDLIALQPLSFVLTKLILHIDSKHINESDYQILSYLLPFRSLAHFSIRIWPTCSDIGSTYIMEIANLFIRQHWNKLPKSGIRLHASSSSSLVRFFRELVSLSSTPSLLTSKTVEQSHVNPWNVKNGSTSNSVNNMITHENDSLMFWIKLWLMSSDELSPVLEQMENSSLLIPSSSSMSAAILPSISHTCVPTISLECMIPSIKGEAESLSIESIQRARTKSCRYINMPSFTIHTCD